MILCLTTFVFFGNIGAEAIPDTNETKGTKYNMMPYEIQHKPAVLMIGITCRTSNEPERGPVDIPKLWGKFSAEGIINKIPNKASDEVIALYCDYEGDYTKPYSIVIGCPVTSIDTIPEGMVAKTIPESSYAVFQAVGEYPNSLIRTWQDVWQRTDLQRTYGGDFEWYGTKFLSGSDTTVEVSIGIEDNR